MTDGTDARDGPAGGIGGPAVIARVTGGFVATWAGVEALLREIEADGPPEDPDDPRHEFVAMVANAKALRVMFGGAWDEGSRKACLDALSAIRGHGAFASRSTHRGTATRQ